jgi:hypothetical protein
MMIALNGAARRRPGREKLMTNDQRIAEIKARAEAATPGPWYVPLYGFTIDTDEKHLLCMTGVSVSEQVDCDMRFIARAREDIPYLLDLLAERDAELKRLQKEVASLAIESIEREKTLARLEAEVMVWAKDRT